MKRSIRSRLALTQPVIVLVVLSILLGTLLIAFLLQSQAERGALTPIATGATGAREQREIDKLDAEIKQIRSDTGGSLFWLKMAGLFVTVGAAVGGYLVGQARTTRERVDAERQITRTDSTSSTGRVSTRRIRRWSRSCPWGHRSCALRRR